MKVKELIDWLTQQDEDLEVMVISYEPDNYHTYEDLNINCGGHVEIYEGIIFLGGTGR